MSKPIPRWALPLGIAFLLTLILGKAALYTLDEIEQAVIVRFGEPLREISDPGLHFKMPFIDEVRRFDKRIMAWDGAPEQIPTRGREFISVDATARWKIVNPRLYMQSMRNEAGAQSRLDDIMDSAVRDKVSSADLVEMVRSQDWQVDASELQRAGIGDKERKLLQKTIKLGRKELEKQILATGRKGVGDKFGIELVKVHIKRMNYVQSVRQEVFQRMKSERQRIAEQYRSEGRGRSEAILGQTEKEVALIRSEAQRQAEVIRGKADAEASKIYNEAYTADPEFFAFYRTLESYSKSVGPGTTMLLSTDSDYFAYLHRFMPPKQGE